MMGAIGGSSDGANSLTALLAVIADPKAAQARLEELTAKSDEAAGFLEQARVESLKADTTKADAATLLAQADEAAKALEVKEVDLAKREQKLRDDAARLSDASKALDADIAANDAKQAELVKREQTVVKAEQDSADGLKQAAAAFEVSIAARKDQLEAGYVDQVAEANRLQREASARFADADKVLSAAMDKKQFYEERVAALQKIVQGN